MIGTEFVGTLSKNLGSTVGKLDGVLQGQLTQLKDLAIQKARAQSEAAISNNPEVKRLSELKNQAPQMKRIIEICKKIKKALASIQGPIEKIAALITKITLIINLAKNLLKLLSALLKLSKANPTLPLTPPIPVPVAPGVTVPGIPNIYPTVGTITTVGQATTKIQNFIDKTTGILDSLSKVLNLITGAILSAVAILRLIKPLLDSICPDSLTNPPTNQLSALNAQSDTDNLNISSVPLVDIDALIQQLEDTIPTDLVETETSYKGYTFEVIEDKTQTSASGRVNKRYAIAKNSQGIEVFRSKSSFATNKQILINELKFKIDNDLSTSSVQESI